MADIHVNATFFLTFSPSCLIPAGMFSIIGANQTIYPHWGFYKGYIRYILPIQVPNNNIDKTNYFRTNHNLPENLENQNEVYGKRNMTFIEQGSVHYIKQGEGFMFDDTYLHDSVNYGDSDRVVLFVDMARKLPWYLSLYNKFLLAVAMRDGTVGRMRKSAIIAA